MGGEWHMMNPQARSLRVLHIDDEPVNLLVMEHLLRELGHAPTGVASAAEALEVLDGAAFDLILTDIHMPQMTGVDLLALLQKTLGPATEIPVVAVTADVMRRTAADYEKLGFAGALSKPLQVTEIDQVLRQASSPPSTRKFVGVGFSRVSLGALQMGDAPL
jgi:CheY-like chemotaxis protein